MTPIPYLFFNGQCAEALDVYANIFDSQVEDKMVASDMPPDFPVPDGCQDWIMHAQLRIGDGILMMSDNITADSKPMAGASVMLSYPAVDEAKAIFDQLAEGGSIQMAWEPTFWSAGFGTLTDRFGVRWMIGCDEPPAT